MTPTSRSSHAAGGIAAAVVIAVATTASSSALLSSPAGQSHDTVAAPTRDLCTRLAESTLPHARIDSADVVAAGAFSPQGGRADAQVLATYKALKPFCRVTATISPVPGSQIGAEVWLPLSGWNGKLQAVGNRGWGGSISYPALAAAIGDGYASASTDTGHRGGGASFALSAPEAIVDAGTRAVHETTVLSKRLVAEFYGTAATRSYWNGCSLGGRQGLAEAQRYPADYDGIVVGDPANNLVDLYAARLLQARAAHRHGESAISPAMFPLLHARVLAACDRLDGVVDGVIEDPRQCRFDPAVLQCEGPGADRAACLTPRQVETARQLYAPVRHPDTGEVLSDGLQPGSEAGWAAVAGPAPENNALGFFRFIVLSNPEWDWREPDFPRHVDEARRRWSPVLDAVSPDISAFVDRGGKLLMYHGWSDPQTPPGNTIAYYRRLRESIGARADRSVRLFMVPGMGHCEGGAGTDTFDKVGVLDRWVQSDGAPETIAAVRQVGGAIQRSRPLCAFGSVAVWDRRGDPDSAASFSCSPATPPARRER